MERWLVSLDTDKVKNYVFATGRLRLITGASALLDVLNRDETRVMAGKAGGDVIFAGGGSAMIEFTDYFAAQQFCQTINSRYVQQTGTATISAAIIPYDDTAGTDHFRQAIRQAGVELQYAKAAGKALGGILRQPLWGRCIRCNTYPALSPDSLCEICNQKAELQADQKGAAKLILDTAGYRWPKGKKFAWEMDDIGNYIGLVYADGNSMGYILEHLISDPKELGSYSLALETAVRNAVVDAVEPAWQTDKDTVPFRIILMGGDDVMFVIGARWALKAASRLCLNFQNELERLTLELLRDHPNWFGGQPLQASMSAGVIIAKSNYPIFALETLAADLLRSAKQLAHQIKRKTGKPACTLDFRVVTSSTANSLEQVQAREYRLPGQSNYWATARPYPCKAVTGLNRPAWENIEMVIRDLKAKEFPRNKLHLWQNLLYSPSDLAAQLELSMMRAHLSQEQKDLMAAVEDQIGLGSASRPFFMTDPLDPARSISPLPDLEEIYPFVW